MTVSWDAMKNAMQYYRTYTGNLSWQQWLLEEGGIDHGTSYVRVVDEGKYLQFVLRWA